MSGAATIPEPAANRAMVTVLLMISALMQALDSTIANVALPYMQGSLSASYDQITWVLTSYVISAAVMTAPVGWLSARFGRKNFLIVSLIGFTLTSMLCGVAGSLSQMVIFRLIQGAFGAALVPLAQSTLLDIYPPRQRGMAMSIFGMGVMVGPILGPTLGGFLTASYDWRFVFFVNLPFGILAIVGLTLLMPGETAKQTARFDWLGFAMLSIGLSALQLALDRGEELDWFSSATVVICLIVAGLGFYLFVVHMLTAKEPFFPRELFGDKNFTACLITVFSVGLLLLATSALMAPFLENLGNYPVAAAGLLMAPRGIGTMLAMLAAGQLTNRMDPRLLMLAGYLMLAGSIYCQEGWTPDESQGAIIAVIIVQGAGLGLVFLPLQVIAFATLRPVLRTQASSLIALGRNVGSAIGISITSALLERQTQYEHAVLTQYVTPFSRNLQAGGALTTMLAPASRAGASLINSLINTQAQIIAYVDDYKLLLVSLIPAAACLLLMRRPKESAASRAAPTGGTLAAGAQNVAPGAGAPVPAE